MVYLSCDTLIITVNEIDFNKNLIHEISTMFATFIFVPLLPEPSSMQITMQDVVGQHPVTNLPETEPHLTEQPSEEGTVTLSTRAAKKPTKRSSSESTSDRGKVVSIYMFMWRLSCCYKH